jgi:hypothetical protein
LDEADAGNQTIGQQASRAGGPAITIVAQVVNYFPPMFSENVAESVCDAKAEPMSPTVAE